MMHTYKQTTQAGTRTLRLNFSFTGFGSFIVKFASWLEGTICLSGMFHINQKSHPETGAQATGETLGY